MNTNNGFTFDIKRLILAGAFFAVILSVTNFFSNAGVYNSAPNGDFTSYWTAACKLRFMEDLSKFYEPYNKQGEPHLNIINARVPDYIKEGGGKYQIGSDRPFIYPPLLAVLLYPISYLGFALACIIWKGINLIALFTSMVLIIRMLGDDKYSYSIFALIVFPLFLYFWPNSWAQEIGQASNLVSFFFVAGLYFTMKKKDFWAGFWLGAGVLIKIYPILILIFLLFRKRYKIVIYAGITIVFFSIITILALGFQNHITYAFEVLPLLGKGTANHANQSVNAFFLRIFTKADVNIFVLTTAEWYVRALIMLAVASMLAFVAYLIWNMSLVRKKAKHIDDKLDNERLMVSYAMITLTTVLITPISWEHNYISALMPLSVAVYFALKRQSLTMLVLLGISYFLMGMNTYHPLNMYLTKGINKLLLSHTFYGGLIMWGVMCKIMYDFTKDNHIVEDTLSDKTENTNVNSYEHSENEGETEPI